MVWKAFEAKLILKLIKIHQIPSSKYKQQMVDVITNSQKKKGYNLHEIKIPNKYEWKC